MSQTACIGPETLLKALARTDRKAAIELLCRRYRAKLIAHASRILLDEAEARDIVQEVLIRAIKEERLFDTDFRIQAWLFRVTRNLCFNLSRDRRRRACLLAQSTTSRIRPPDQIELLFGEEQKEEILLAFDRLSLEHREILMLRYYEDQSYTEIAQTLSIKLGTVMSRLSRARDRLLAIIEEEPDFRAAS
jgi:RNA polymerase sigma-70 factor (ECF subfamily)